jgi:hypothetical protein
VKYNIKAIETKFKGYTFRSRLEARWAAMFELLGWQWDYEPVDFNGWIPDFAIYGKTLVYVEFPQDVADRIGRSGCKDEVLILGQRPEIKSEDEIWEEKHFFGWLGEHYEDDEMEWGLCPIGYFWPPEPRQPWIGFCSLYGGYDDRITGKYDGSHPIDAKEKVVELWARAHEATRWMAKSDSVGDTWEMFQ